MMLFCNVEKRALTDFYDNLSSVMSYMNVSNDLSVLIVFL